MFAIKRWLIATICIVGFLVASLGLYEAFRPLTYGQTSGDYVVETKRGSYNTTTTSKVKVSTTHYRCNVCGEILALHRIGLTITIGV